MKKKTQKHIGIQINPKAPLKENYERFFGKQSLKEYVQGDPESVSEAFQKADIDMNSPIIVVELQGGPGSPPGHVRKEEPKAFMAKLEKMRSSFDDGVWYEYGDEIDAQGMGADRYIPKLTVNFSDSGGEFIFQGRKS